MKMKLVNSNHNYRLYVADDTKMKGGFYLGMREDLVHKKKDYCVVSYHEELEAGKIVKKYRVNLIFNNILLMYQFYQQMRVR